MFLTVLDRIETRIWTEISRQNMWTNVYGLARTVIALATLLTFMFNSTQALFKDETLTSDLVYCGSYSAMGMFCLLPVSYLELSKWVAICILVVVATGWRPRLTAIPHWYVCYSFHASSRVIDGGDQIAAVLTLLILPVALLDTRRWHWQTNKVEQTNNLAKLFALSTYWVIRLQVSIIYFHAVVAKMNVPEWMDGTALYYWFNNPAMGLSYPLKGLFEPLLESSLIALFTWSAMLLELLLAAALFMSPRFRKTLFWCGIIFHLLIAIFMGITSFAIVMIGALILYLIPPFSFLRLRSNTFVTVQSEIFK